MTTPDSSDFEGHTCGVRNRSNTAWNTQSWYCSKPPNHGDAHQAWFHHDEAEGVAWYGPWADLSPYDVPEDGPWTPWSTEQVQTMVIGMLDHELLAFNGPADYRVLSLVEAERRRRVGRTGATEADHD